ncbi:MAG TPA: hypothetical protein VKR58_01195 [Aquella sp.]|nr:hypothetical protein [Aquella sp.]
MKSTVKLCYYLLGLMASTYTFAAAGADWYFLIRNTSVRSIEITQLSAVCETSQTELPLSLGPLDSRIVKVTEMSKNGHRCTQAKEKKFVFTINGLAVTAYSCYNKKLLSTDCYVRDANHLHNIQVTTRNNYNLSVAIRGRSPTVEQRYVVLDYKDGDISLPIWCTALSTNKTHQQCFRDNNYDFLTYYKGNPEAMFNELVKNVDNRPHKINLLRT